MHRQMADMMKTMGQGAKRGPMAGLANMFGMGGGGMPSPEMLAQLKDKLPPGTLPDMPGLPAELECPACPQAQEYPRPRRRVS